MADLFSFHNDNMLQLLVFNLVGFILIQGFNNSYYKLFFISFSLCVLQKAVVALGL